MFSPKLGALACTRALVSTRVSAATPLCCSSAETSLHSHATLTLHFTITQWCCTYTLRRVPVQLKVDKHVLEPAVAGFSLLCAHCWVVL